MLLPYSYIYIYRHTYMCYMTLDIHGHLLRRYDWTPKIYPKHRTSRGMTGCLGSKRSLFLQLSFGWWFQAFFMFTPKIGEDSHFDQYFANGSVQPPTCHFLTHSLLRFLLSLLLHDFPETLAPLVGVNFNFHHHFVVNSD